MTSGCGKDGKSGEYQHICSSGGTAHELGENVIRISDWLDMKPPVPFDPNARLPVHWQEHFDKIRAEMDAERRVRNGTGGGHPLNPDEGSK